MLSKNELRALSNVSNGADDMETLSGVLDLSKPQAYKIVRSLKEKDIANLERGKVTIHKKTHIATLLDILHYSPDSYIVLADSGTEIIKHLREPHSVSELVSMTGLHQTTVTRKIDLMRQMGMLKKIGGKYVIADENWPKLLQFATEYDRYSNINDPRIPFGSDIIFLSNDIVVFATDRSLNYPKTAFSKYGDYGMDIYPGTEYYCSLDHEPDIWDVFLHSLYVVESEKSWRNKMLALIFYVKHKNVLGGLNHPVIDEMRRVLNGERVEGWAPIKEMQERAEMYGVNLHDN